MESTKIIHARLFNAKYLRFVKKCRRIGKTITQVLNEMVDEFLK